MAWLWLAARDGAFGPVRTIHSERRLRSADGLPAGPAQVPDPGPPQGVRLFDVGPGGGARLHYPDLVLETPVGRRVALELELSGKSPRRLAGILEAYGADPRIDAVVYVVADPRLEARIRTAATRTGATRKLFLRRCALSPAMAALATQLAHPAAARPAARPSRQAGRAPAEAGR